MKMCMTLLFKLLSNLLFRHYMKVNDLNGPPPRFKSGYAIYSEMHLTALAAISLSPTLAKVVLSY